MLLRITVATCLLLLACFLPINSQVSNQSHTFSPTQGSSTQQQNWVDRTMQSLTPDERIGQLFMVAAYSNKDNAHKQYISNLIKKHKIGGLIFMQGTANKQISLTNHFQSISKVPLLISMDAEWGLSMRLKKVPTFPKQLTLGAIQDNYLIQELGREIGRECKRLGVHVNLAPVVDVNNNPNNPVINDRSFGEDKYNVAKKGIEFMRGLESQNVLACAKHFPGHGDTDKDSHHTLPVINHNLDRLRSIEFYPFQELIRHRVSGVMMAHLSVPHLDNSPINSTSNMTIPTTLSKKVVTDLLKNEMGYQGLVFTDALNMKGVSSYFAPGEVDVKALIAGNDILLFSQNVGKAITAIKAAIQRGEITQAEIDQRVRKILAAKYRSGAAHFKPISTNNLNNDLYYGTEILKRKLIENAVTVARDDRGLVPFRDLEQHSFASIAIGATTLTTFQYTLGKYSRFSHHTLRQSATAADYQKKLKTLQNYDRVVVSIHGMSKRASKDYGISRSALDFIRQLQATTEVVVVLFGSPYSLRFFDDSRTAVVAYESSNIAQSVAAQILFGGLPAKGKLPVTASPQYRFNQGVTTAGNMRLQYTIPESVGINSAELRQIDAIAQEAINIKATPGCQVLVAKDGKVIWEKSYGHHTYSKKTAVSNNDLYDLASITKIAASVMGLMDLYESRELSLDSKLREVLPELAYTNKADLVIRDILMHQSGLKDWIPFYAETLPGKEYNYVYKKKRDIDHSVVVADNMYMKDDFLRTMWDKLNESDLKSKTYRYSDLGYYYFKQIIEQYRQQSLKDYVQQRYYNPLGLGTMCYNPKDCFSERSITPTENDTKWRKQLVHGYVHDMGAAMQNGIGGHAGLFSNANDLAVLMQMLMNGGHYGGRHYFNRETIETFTRRADPSSTNRRGLGFDKPEVDPDKDGPTSKLASNLTFGHTGFTGTCVWADPKHNLIYVFLSNRVYPRSNNWKLVKEDIRPRIHDVIYQAVLRAERRKNTAAVQFPYP